MSRLPARPARRPHRVRATTTTAVLGAGLVLSGAVGPASAAPIQPVWTETSSAQIGPALPDGNTANHQSVAPDLDADGDLDVVTSVYDEGLAVQLNLGDGVLAPPLLVADPEQGMHLAVGDLDEDGYPDVVWRSFTALHVHHGGPGGLGPAQVVPLALNGLTVVAVADMDGDGHLDVVTGGDSGLAVLRGDGAGGLASTGAPELQSFWGVSAFRAADLDQDGRLDLVGFSYPGELFVALTTSTGELGVPTFVPYQAILSSFAVGDVDADGDPDVVFGSQSNTQGLFLVRNDGSGSFAPPETIAPFAGQYGASLVDLNQDGVLDVASMSRAGMGTGQLHAYLGAGDGTFVDQVVVTTALGNDVLAADLDGNGRPDLRTVSENDRIARVFSNEAPVPLPTVTLDPVAGAVTAGTPLTLTSTADGDDDVRWETSIGGDPWVTVGDPTENLDLLPTAADDGRSYRAVFTNVAGEVTSAVATLTVLPAGVVVTDQPLDISVVSGQTATFSAAATGDPVPTVQWEVSTDGGAVFAPVDGATGTVLEVVATHAQDGALYRAAFTNTAGTVTSEPATLGVLPLGPVVSLQPQDATVATGQPVTFSAAATGDPVPSVRWQVSTGEFEPFTDLVGETATTLELTPTGSSTGYRYRALFTGADGDVVASDEATLTVTWTPAAAAQDVVARQTGPGQITITWTASPGGGSNPVTGYAVGYGTGAWGNGADVDADTVSMVFDGLAEGDYTAVVIPITADGFDDGFTNRVAVPVTVGPWTTLPVPPGTLPSGAVSGGRPAQAAPVRSGAGSRDAGDRLARTGTDAADAAELALASLALGGLLLLVSRRTRRRPA